MSGLQTDTYGGEIHTPTLSDRQGRHFLQSVSHHRDVFAHARSPVDRSQSASCGQRPDCRVGKRLGRLYRHHPQEQRHRRRGAQGLRVQHRCVGQVAQHASGRNYRGRPVRQMAHRLRLPVFLRFSRGEASQWEPQLVRNTAYVEHPHTSGGHNYYHLSEDLADDAIYWLNQHKALSRTSHSSCIGRPAPLMVRFRFQRMGG